MKRPDILRTIPKKNGGQAGNGEVPLEEAQVRDILDMFHNEPIFTVSKKAFLSKVLAEPFSFQIPKLGLRNSVEVTNVIKNHWMPWLRVQFDWEKALGVTPFMLIPLEGVPDHTIPYTPDPTTGYITASLTEKKPPRVRFHWYWKSSTGATDNEEKNMLWIISENAPDASGRVRSPLASLLSSYRSMLKLRNAQDVASTQAARPVHVIESNPPGRTATDDGLSRHIADFDRAAGIGKARRERMQQAQLRVKQAELYRSLHEVDQYNRQRATANTTMWTDTPADMLEEMDAGFSNRVVSLGEHYRYTTAARPQLVADYNKAESQFNMMAASVMDFALELLTPTGTARSQNIKGAEQYENERIREQSNRFETILRPVIVMAYRKQLQAVMDDARMWRISRLGGNAANVAQLYPELDVIIDLSNTAVTTDEEMRTYWMDGIISQETYGKHVLRNKNIPLESMTLSAWPDNFPKERLVKVGGTGEKQTMPKKVKAKKPEAKKPDAVDKAIEKPPKKRKANNE